MLLDDRSSQCHARDSRGVVQGVIRQPGYQPEALLHVQQGTQVVICRRGRIAADTVQYCQLLTATSAGGLDGFSYLFGIGHAGGDDHRLAGTGHIADQRQIDRFKRGNLVGWRIQVFE
ncbi:hypothetical protein D3C84_905610 [compost metagenome]